MGELIEGAVQQAPQPARQAKAGGSGSDKGKRDPAMLPV
jgi:hypothetical protein